jgi:hypothetical protein
MTKTVRSDQKEETKSVNEQRIAAPRKMMSKEAQEQLRQHRNRASMEREHAYPEESTAHVEVGAETLLLAAQREVATLRKKL